jgi:hypothetical protein
MSIEGHVWIFMAVHVYEFFFSVKISCKTTVNWMDIVLCEGNPHIYFAFFDPVVYYSNSDETTRCYSDVDTSLCTMYYLMDVLALEGDWRLVKAGE